ncbi:MAG: hypothetical protein PHT12_03870 [Patescibacteria group bacterium]|nr:hypothetical protein [Patescibacteria group bacterium]
MTSNNLQNKIVGGLLALSLLMPMAVAAEEDSGAAARPSAVRAQRNFCTVLTARPLNERFATQIQQREKNLTTRRTEVNKRLKDNRAQRDSKLEGLRVQQDQKRGGAVDALQEKFKGEEQKQAILKFQAAVAAAAEVRRAAVDASTAAYRKGLDDALASRKTAVDAAVTAFRTAVKAAEDKAKADCAVTGADPVAVREVMRVSVEAARTQFKTALQAAEKVGPQASDLAKTRQDAVKKAMDDWKAAVEKARDELKTALAALAPATGVLPVPSENTPPTS